MGAWSKRVHLGYQNGSGVLHKQHQTITLDTFLNKYCMIQIEPYIYEDTFSQCFKFDFIKHAANIIVFHNDIIKCQLCFHECQIFIKAVYSGCQLLLLRHFVSCPYLGYNLYYW